MSCNLHAELGIHDAIRQTWGAECFGDLRFFVGRGDRALASDEVRFDVPDNKETLMYKVAEICRWMVDQGYGLMFKVNTNTYVNMPRLMEAQDRWIDADWCGAQIGRIGEYYAGTGAWSWIQGSGNWMSRKASAIVAAEAVNYALGNMARLMQWNGLISPYLHSEDLWIGQVLTPRRHELNVVVDMSYSNGPLTYWSQSNYIKRNCVPEWLKAMHAVRPDPGQLDRILAEYRARG